MTERVKCIIHFFAEFFLGFFRCLLSSAKINDKLLNNVIVINCVIQLKKTTLLYVVAATERIPKLEQKRNIRSNNPDTSG